LFINFILSHSFLSRYALSSAFCRVCVSRLEFESGSQLSHIQDYSFAGCSFLSSICIPASVKKLCQQCFHTCQCRRTVIFETGSRLSGIERCAVDHCSSHLSICVFSSVEHVSQYSFAHGGSARRALPTACRFRRSHLNVVRSFGI
jgi:hypothetical protein